MPIAIHTATASVPSANRRTRPALGPSRNTAAEFELFEAILQRAPPSILSSPYGHTLSQVVAKSPSGRSARFRSIGATRPNWFGFLLRRRSWDETRTCHSLTGTSPIHDHGVYRQLEGRTTQPRVHPCGPGVTSNRHAWRLDFRRNACIRHYRAGTTLREVRPRGPHAMRGKRGHSRLQARLRARLRRQRLAPSDRSA